MGTEQNVGFSSFALDIIHNKIVQNLYKIYMATKLTPKSSWILFPKLFPKELLIKIFQTSDILRSTQKFAFYIYFVNVQFMGKIFSNFVCFSESRNFNKTIKQIKLADCIVYAHFGLLTIFLIDFLTWYSILVPFIQLALNSIRKKNIIYEKSCGELSCNAQNAHFDLHRVTISKNWKLWDQNQNCQYSIYNINFPILI